MTKKIFFFKKQSKQSHEFTFYNTDSFSLDYDLKKVLLFCHAMCGCDTTSSFHNLGKTKIFQILSEDHGLRRRAEDFNDPDADRNILYSVGIDIVKKTLQFQKSYNSYSFE